MARRPTARDMERVAAALPPRLERAPAPLRDALGMRARRGLRPSRSRPNLPFAADISAETADALAERLGHYAFRLFVRGVIHTGRHLYVVNSRPDLMTNIGRAIAEGLQAQHPQLVSRRGPACEVNSAVRTL